MKHKIFIVPHTHYDAEVFLVEKDTLEIGYANLVGALKLMRTNPAMKFVLDFYGVRPADFHIVGSLLEREWLALLREM